MSFQDCVKRVVTATVSGRTTRIPVEMITHADLEPVRLWSPGSPDLYDVQVRLVNGDTVVDDVRTYFGMRKVEVRNGRVYLNNCLIYQRLILDQGYWPQSLLTPPSDEAIQKDIELTKAFGYNGARKHQKLEGPALLLLG